MQAAQKFLARGQLDKAIVEYERIVQSDPKDARALLKLGDLYTKNGANKQASATYRKVAEQYAEQGFFLKAVAVCKQILKLDAGQLDVWEKLAEMYELLSLVSDALATYEQIYEAHTRAGNNRKAQRALEKLAELDPENVAARIRYAEALAKGNRVQDAALAFAQGAELLKKQGRVDDFLKVGERLLFHQPDNHAFARDLAAIYLDRNDTKLALAKLQPCFSADPRDLSTLRLLARAFEQLGQIQKTVSVLKEVARICAEENRDAEQASVLRKIVTLAPGDAEARRDLSQLTNLSADDVIEMEEDDYDSIEVEDDDEAPTRKRSGLGVSNLAGAAASSASRMPSEPQRPAGEQKRAQVSRMLGECDVFMRYGLYDKMITQLHQVLDLDPTSIEARAKLKDVYLKTNRTNEAVMQLIMLAEAVGETDAARARDHLREALKLDPTNGAVAQRLAALDTLVGRATIPSDDDEDEVIILDDEEVPAADGLPHDFSDVTLTDARQNREESFASLNAVSELPAAAPEEDDDEPEMVLEDAGEEIDEIVIEAEDDEEIVMARQPAPHAAGKATSEAPPATEEPHGEIPDELAEALEEVDFYLKQGMSDEARDTLNDALESFPDHPAALAKLALLGGDAADTDDAFALAQKLADQVVPGPSPASSSGAGPIEMADVLAQFKRGVAKQVDKNDSATHYDLGIAYMEMGLHAEGIDEFKLCLSDPTRQCTANTMIGLSYVQKGEMEPSIDHFKRALAAKPSDDEEIGLWFEIGNAHELLGKNMEALVWYEKVEERNPEFRDVAQRIERLGVSRTAEQEADAFDEMFDNMILKDD